MCVFVLLLFESPIFLNCHDDGAFCLIATPINNSKRWHCKEDSNCQRGGRRLAEASSLCLPHFEGLVSPTQKCSWVESKEVRLLFYFRPFNDTKPQTPAVLQKFRRVKVTLSADSVSVGALSDFLKTKSEIRHKMLTANLHRKRLCFDPAAELIGIHSSQCVCLHWMWMRLRSIIHRS